MQTVATGWTAEERDSVRTIAQNTQISWHKQSTLGNRTFTIGFSTIGGNDAIGVNPGAVGSPGNYRYFDESSYVTGLAWERGLQMPAGGLTKALAEVRLDNTSGRFTPRYMGGRSELYTAILPRRPLLINAGFNYGGVDQTLPVFAGLLNKQPNVDIVNGAVGLEAADYVDFFEGKYLDREVMFTAQRTDQVMTTLLQGTLGMNTAQYDLDYGINIIPFGLFESGTKMADIFNQLAQAEAGHFYQDETGIFKFRNRQWGDSSPFNTVQRIVLTGQVINAEAPSDDHLINTVEIISSPRMKQQNQLVFKLTSPIPIYASQNNELFINFDDPMLQVQTPLFVGNTLEDETGTSITPVLKASDVFAKAAKYIFTTPTDGFITQLSVYGRAARVSTNLYYRAQDDSSVTAFEERHYSIENDYIGNQSWAQSLSQMILNDFSSPENLQVITIRALPELQLYDMVSWQGRYWRIFNIRSTLNPDVGLIQELTMLQRNVTTYFRIGVSTIGSGDKIAP